VKAVNGIFQGTLGPDKKTMKGTWTQGGPVLPLEFIRTADVAETPKPPDPSVIAAAAANSSFGIPVEMTVPVAPTPFRANGKNHLVYELHLHHETSAGSDRTSPVSARRPRRNENPVALRIKNDSSTKVDLQCTG
jgi:hypothetical protein